tara:strand:- start:513 stop:689 length:177 start_codon:yes stop_codon:yes gene_type:complete
MKVERVEGWEESIIYTDQDRVACSGKENDHPRVYYTVPEKGFVVCGYCDTKFAKLNDS